MKVRLLGTGCPQVDPRRMGPSTLVSGSGGKVLVDAGSGVTQRLVEAGTNGAEVDALLLTHLHSDHVMDVYQLAISSWHQNRDRGWRVYGPRGTGRFLEGLWGAWRAEREGRWAHERRTSVAAFDLEVEELCGGEEVEVGGMKVSAVKVEHEPVEGALGYVFEEGGEKAALSGDTRYCEALVEASAGAGVLVHEAFVNREGDGGMLLEGTTRTLEGMRAVRAYHSSVEEAARAGANAGVGCLVLHHFVPTRFDEGEVLERVRSEYGGFVLLGEDLMELDVGARVMRSGGVSLSWR